MGLFSILSDPAAAAAASLQSCPTLCDPIDGSPPGSPHPWDSPGKNTGVGCHFLLQCTKVKSESEVAQSGPTLLDPWTAAHQARCLSHAGSALSCPPEHVLLLVSEGWGSSKPNHLRPVTQLAWRREAGCPAPRMTCWHKGVQTWEGCQERWLTPG